MVFVQDGSGKQWTSTLDNTVIDDTIHKGFAAICPDQACLASKYDGLKDALAKAAATTSALTAEASAAAAAKPHSGF